MEEERDKRKGRRSIKYFFFIGKKSHKLFFIFLINTQIFLEGSTASFFSFERLLQESRDEGGEATEDGAERSGSSTLPVK